MVINWRCSWRRAALSARLSPKALINAIDTMRLLEKGQGDGAVMFTCYVASSGNVRGCLAYRETPGSKLLKKAVEDAFWSCRCIPAIYNGKRTDVLMIGTVILVVRDGTPHLRIYLNQNHDDVVSGNDFIAPQPVFESADWTGWGYNLAAYKAAINGKNGWIEAAVHVDRNGNQKDFRVTVEDPPGFGMATVAKQNLCKGQMDSRLSERPRSGLHLRFSALVLNLDLAV